MGFVSKQIGEFEACMSTKAADKIEAASNIDNFKNFVTEAKPPQIVNMIDMELLYVNVQTELNINGRLPWNCPEGLRPEALTDASARLNEAEMNMADKLRKDNESFIEALDDSVSADKIADIEKSFAHFDEDNSDTLNKEEFFAAMTAVGANIAEKDQDAEFQKAAGNDDMITKDEYVAYMVKFYDQSDSYDAIINSSEKIGSDFSKLSQEDQEYLASKLGDDGDFASYVKSQFS